MEKKKHKILVVDDDYLSQRMMGLVLAEGGYSYDTAFNGEEAVKAVQSQCFDLILMDLQMPVLDGYEATRIIRKWEAGKGHVPIVALTAMMFDNEVKSCFDAGMDDCVIKPFDVAKLYQLMDAYIEKSAAKREVDEKKLTDEVPLLDVQAALPRFQNDTQIYQEFLLEFLQMLPERMEQFQTAFLSGDFQSLSDHAHKLKGVAASMGAMQLSALVARVDHLSRNRESKLIEESLAQCDKIVLALQENATIILSKHT